MTYSFFYVPLIVSGLAAAGVEGALEYAERRGAALIPRGISPDVWCDWADAMAAANSWMARGAADALFERMTSGSLHWGTARNPYAPDVVQLQAMDALFRHDAQLGTVITAAAIAHIPTATKED